MVNSAPNGFLLGIAVKYIIAHTFMDNNSQGSSHRPRAVGGAYKTKRILFMKEKCDR